MDSESRKLLEDILTAQVLLLSAEIARQTTTVIRPGNDFTKEAVAKIKANRSRILEMLLID